MQPQASQHLNLTPLAALLGRVGAELTDLAAAVEQLHPLVSAHAQQAAPATPTAGAPAPKNLTPDDIQALQGIDHIEQKLRALAGFLADLAHAATPDWQLDAQPALAAITLSDLASRLAGNTTLTPAQDAAAGDCELF
ncbi:hypothetical protein [Mesorhizobium sp. ANAO-SY3R2]|uniref:hypothetical protein n=1 Tax=Mesorhizobium sp. ANAO-SY3R2 TaxID=3166644 RepID=UPI00366FAC13